MSWAGSSEEPSRRRRYRPSPEAWRQQEASEVEEEAWACPPSPRRNRWERPSAEWRPEEEPEARARKPSWRGRPRNRPAGRPWGRPGPVKPWSSQPRESGGRPRRPRRGGGRWSSSGRGGGGRPGQGAWGSPEAPSAPQSPDGGTRAWGSPGRESAWERPRDSERPAWEPRPESPAGAGGRWASAGSRREESRSPSRERRSLGSSGRDARQERRGSTSSWSQQSREQAAHSSSEAGGRWGRKERRGREPRSPARKQTGWGSPKREERQEGSGSARRREREQGEVDPGAAGGRWSPAWGRRKSYQNRSRDEGSSDRPKREWRSPNGETRGQGSPVRYRGVESLDGGGAEGDSRERGGEEKRAYAARSSSPKAGTFLADLVAGGSAVPKEWTPCESVVSWWMQCQSILSNKTRDQLMSVCPRPTLPNRSSETPQVNREILSLLNKKREAELRSATVFSLTLQDEVLDMLAPAMTIYEMAEEAIARDEPVDPMELREWSRHLIRFIGSINNRFNYKHRSQVLSCINPRLKSVVSKMSGQSSEGMLFAEDKVKLLKEIILRFPQLTQVWKQIPRKRFPTFTRVTYDKEAQRKLLLRSRSRLLGTGRRGTADQRAERSRSQEAEEQGPAERR